MNGLKKAHLVKAYLIIMCFILVPLATVSLVYAIQRLNAPESGTLVFEVRSDLEGWQDFSVNGFSKKEIIVNQSRVGQFPLVWSVKVPEDAINVTIFVHAAHSLDCDISWYGDDGSHYVIHQSDIRDDVTSVKCEWVRWDD